MPFELRPCRSVRIVGRKHTLDIFRRAGVRKVHAADEGAMEMLVMEQVKLGMEKWGFWTAVDPQCDIRVCP